VPPAPPSASPGVGASEVNKTTPVSVVPASNVRRRTRLRACAGATEITLSETDASSALG